ncbi:MAG TPA: LPS assembly protein LptD [Kiritimatiellia bacterium]|nr:LPS assembly protein LptD [Kiritimatiellia bacterium]HRZ13337.1 LPS assembly protein LptD [Kiritimatiellia bacterium]HSA18786.1 LPS assembly protein LptD [Kiritimatiellia bacterium]
MRRRIQSRWMGVLAAGWLAAAGAAAAEKQTATVGGVEIHADQLEYESGKRLLTGRGHVVIVRLSDVLRADLVTYRTDTQDAVAQGNVILERAGSLWRGEKLKYNFGTRLGDFGQFEYYTDPYYIRAQESRQVSSNEFVMKKAVFTTCEGERPLVFMKMREARIIDDIKLRAKGVWIFLGPLPLLYTPFLSKRLDSMGWEFIPGRSGRSGYFLLSAYTFPITTNLLSSTHIDYRSERGWAGGQDFIWGKAGSSPRGLVTAYYADDQKPFKNDEEEEEWSEWVDSDRYRLRLSDIRSVTDRDYLVTELNYLSDPRVIEEFFNEEFRMRSQPENRISLIHRGDRFTASLAVNKRLNDFFGNINRLPEARLDVPRLQLGDTPFYYETYNGAAWLEREYPEGQETNNYDSIRLDSSHMVYWPTRHFGFLNITPRGGYRATYYSTAYDVSYLTNQTTVVESNVVIGITNSVERQVEERAVLRSLYETGVEVSFKAFKVLNEATLGRDYQGLRHVVEPYAKHTYVPEPNIRPDELPQFDGVDELDRRHDVYFGVRNKLQTKRLAGGILPLQPAETGGAASLAAPSISGQRVHDLVDVGVFTTYRIERFDEVHDFSDIYFDARLRLVDWLPIDTWVSYDPYESEVTEARVEASWLNLEDASRLSLQYLYRLDKRNQVAAELHLFPYDPWSFRVYTRYNIDISELEEQGYFVEHKTSCLGIGTGYKRVEEDDDDQIWFQVWLTAFPKSYIKMGL